MKYYKLTGLYCEEHGFTLIYGSLKYLEKLICNGKRNTQNYND